MKLLAAAAVIFLAASPALSDDAPSAAKEQKQPVLEALDGRAKRLGRSLWIDVENKWVIVDGEIAVREGALEVFACPKDTKDHEAIVSVYARAYMVHAALLAVGAKPGRPVRFVPEYRPASGARVDIMVLWTDKDGKRHKTPAQQWIRNAETGEELKHHWVFGGSSFWTDPDTGERYYQAEAGELICLSNFSSATMDLPIESTQANDDLLYEAFAERIPERGTRVRLVLMPHIEPNDDEDQ